MKENEVLIHESKNIWKRGVLNMDKREIYWESFEDRQKLRKISNDKLEFNTHGKSQKFCFNRLTFFRHNDKLFILYNNELIEITEDTISILKKRLFTLTFKLTLENKTIFELTHRQIKPLIPLSIDPTPFISEEDFDLRIFIHNVMTDSGRRYRYRTNSKPAEK